MLPRLYNKPQSRRHLVHLEVSWYAKAIREEFHRETLWQGHVLGRGAQALAGEEVTT
jgi:hypothetical protein